MTEQPRKGPKPLASLTDDQLLMVIDRATASGKAVSGPYARVDLEREHQRRIALVNVVDGKAVYDPAQMGLEIALRSQAAPAQRVSYTELYTAFNGAPPPRGNGWAKPLTAKLFELSEICHQEGIPFFSALVVDHGTRELGEDARKGFFKDWSDKVTHIKPINDRYFASELIDEALKATPAQIDVLRKHLKG